MNKPIVTDSIETAAQFLRSGQLVAFPTETVYGLGAALSDEEAIRNIYIAKGRASDNPLIVHIASKEQLHCLVSEVTNSAELLIESLWPGPLTIVLNKHISLSNTVTAGLSSVAVRYPAHPTARRLIEMLGEPIVAPSANLSGKPSATHSSHVLSDLSDHLACVLTGEVVHGLESTVVDCRLTDSIDILRTGSIAREELEQIIHISSANDDCTIRSPGIKYKHYAPEAEVILIEDPSSISLADHSPGKLAYIGIDALGSQLTDSMAQACVCRDNQEYAVKLFDFFRICDKEGIDKIFCQIPSSIGIGSSILERITKASSKS